MPYPCLSPCMFLSPAVSYTRSCSTYVRRAGIKEPFPANLPRARCEDATTLSRPNGFDSEPLASTQRGAPDDVFILSGGGVVCEERSSWKEVGARRLRAPPARNFARAWRELLAPARSCGTPWTSADDVKALTQSQLATAWLAGAISPPNLFHPWRRGHRRTPSGLEPGGAAQLPKAVVHHHNSGITAPLDLVRCPDSSGQRPHPAALILSGK
jgi:hypothetical protein